MLTSTTRSSKYGIALNLICLSLFGAMYIIFCLFKCISGDNRNGGTREGGQDLKIIYPWYDMSVFKTSQNMVDYKVLPGHLPLLWRYL